MNYEQMDVIKMPYGYVEHNGNKSRFWLFLVILLIVMGHVCFSLHAEEAISMKQEFLVAIEDDLQSYRDLYGELQFLEEIGLKEEIQSKKIELYTVMIDILKAKREVFQNEIEACEDIYRELKSASHKEIDVTALDSCHLRIRGYEEKIEKVSQYINTFYGRIATLEYGQGQRKITAPLYRDLETERQSLIDSMRTLMAQKENLSIAGASPHEINQIDRQVRIYEGSLRSVCAQMDYSESEIEQLISSFKEQVDSEYDRSSLKRKNRVDQYKYRFDERDAKKTVRYKRINEKDSAVGQIAKEPSIRIDKRLEAPRSDHNKPSKIIEKDRQ